MKNAPQADLKRGLAGLGQINGIMGKYHFTAEGNMIVETGVGVFRNGQIVGK